MITSDVLGLAEVGRRLSAAEALVLADCSDPRPLMPIAAALRDAGHGGLVSYSRKVFIPLTQLCRDVCHYCTFAHPPRRGEPAYLGADEVLAIARAGARAGCHEALFTLGDKPELRYAAARDALALLGHETTLAYLAEMAGIRPNVVHLSGIALDIDNPEDVVSFMRIDLATRARAVLAEDPVLLVGGLRR